MRKATKIAIACAVAVTALMAVLVVVNPFGMGNSETPIDNPNGNSETNPIDGEGEVTNPSEEAGEATFRISPGKFWWHDGEQPIERIDSAGLVTTYVAEGTGSYLAGESREGVLTIWNLNDHEAVFSVDYRIPDNVIIGYHRPLSEVRDWVWISNRWPTIPANEKVLITVRLGMPESAIVSGPKWEFWIAVIDRSQTGSVITEYASRFLVTMK